MKRMAMVTLVMAAILVSAFGQKQDETKQNEKFSRQLKKFESDWLTAILNQDKTWLESFLAGKLIVVPSENDAVKTRALETNEMIDPKLKPDEMKIRITGNITLLTNAGNRSFYFLDTFNKRDGKWQIIATHFSQTPQYAAENSEQAIIQLESEWGDAAFKKNTAELKGIIADDFSGVESSGRAVNKTQFINNIESGNANVQLETVENLKIQVYGDTAVVSGQHLVKGKKTESDNNLKLFFTKVWTRRDGQWKVVNYQATETR